MKTRKFMPTADLTTKRKMPTRGSILALSIFGLMLGLLVAGGLPSRQHAAGEAIRATLPLPAPSPPDPKQVLDLEAADDLISEFTDALNIILKEDERKVESITEKWEGKELKGKTRGQAIVFLMPDVKRVVLDEATRNRIMTKWMTGPEEGDDDEETAEVTARPAVLQPKSTTTGGQLVVPKDADAKPDFGLIETTLFSNMTGQVKAWTPADKVNYKGQSWSIIKDVEDPNAEFKAVNIHKGLMAAIDAGVTIPADLKIYLIIDRDKAPNCPDCEDVKTIAFKRGLKFAPVANVIIKGIAPMRSNPFSDRKLQGLEKPAITIIHEIGHILHERRDPEFFWSMPKVWFPNGISMKDKYQADKDAVTAGKLGLYAGGNQKEFVAEVFAASVLGMKFNAETWELYNRLRGPIVRGVTQ